MCEETDIESVLAAMNTTALVFERRPAKKFQAPRDLNPTITWSLHVPAISIYRDKAPLSVSLTNAVFKRTEFTLEFQSTGTVIQLVISCSFINISIRGESKRAAGGDGKNCHVSAYRKFLRQS